MRVVAVLVVCCAAVTAFAGEPVDLPPTSTRALLRWLRDGVYRQRFVPEPAVHESEAAVHGPHVRTWYGPVLVQDLRGGVLPLRRGAAMVKELYFAGTDEVVGWSVMRKVRRRSTRGRGWYFFETFDGRDALSSGRGVGICVGCHAAGKDFLLSAFRP
ncbi:MAG TPA: hypothetical protein VMS22_10400 [Candidatus Eisenbacteria bacterium]|nr:hypothetical protein [Candidatus Eisenbacteria bacterium]